MFYVLALALSLAVLFIVLACATIACAAALWGLRRFLPSLAPRASANLLFTMRTLPVFAAVAVTIGLALPAFLRFEPHSTGELIGARLLALATLGGMVLALAAVRAWRMARATRDAQKQWRKDAQQISIAGVNAPIYCSEAGCPLLAVTGIFRARIFVSRNVTRSLSAPELSAAIAHEMAHVSAWDNLKQLLLKISQPPRWTGLLRASDAAWLNASEMAADEGALARGASALDLSSALIKVGRLSRRVATTEMIAASYLLPIAPESSIAMRVRHLEKLLGREDSRQRSSGASGARRYRATVVALLLALGYAVCVNAVLPWMHDVLEMLVR